VVLFYSGSSTVHTAVKKLKSDHVYQGDNKKLHVFMGHSVYLSVSLIDIQYILHTSYHNTPTSYSYIETDSKLRIVAIIHITVYNSLQNTRCPQFNFHRMASTRIQQADTFCKMSFKQSAKNYLKAFNLVNMPSKKSHFIFNVYRQFFF